MTTPKFGTQQQRGIAGSWVQGFDTYGIGAYDGVPAPNLTKALDLKVGFGRSFMGSLCCMPDNMHPSVCAVCYRRIWQAPLPCGLTFVLHATAQKALEEAGAACRA